MVYLRTNTMSETSMCVVLGGSGFLGTRLCKSLLGKGFRVRSVSRSGRPKGQPEPWWPEVEWVAAPMGTELCSRALRQASLVFHLASTTPPSASNADMTYDLESNVMATVHTMEAAAYMGVQRVIFASS